MKKILLVLLLAGLLFAAGEKANTNILTAMPKMDINGRAIEYNSKVYLIDVWATWCPPCRQTIPELVALQSEMPEIKVIGLSVDQSVMSLPQFMIEYNINYPVAMAGDSLKALPPVRGIPTMFIVNKDGKIVKTIVGYTPKETLVAEIQKLL